MSAYTESSLQVIERYSSVPYRYVARLIRSCSVDNGKGGTSVSNESMVVHGSVHPEPYNHDMATLTAYSRMAHLTDAGWAIESMVVSGYSAKDANL